MRPIDAVLSRLEGHKLRENGRDRWRACCPGHDGSNPSALSIGVGADDQVLLKCWHGCDVNQIVGALGLELQDLFPPKPADGHGRPPMRRRGLLTARQALDVVEFETSLVRVASRNLAAGHALTEADLERLAVAGDRIQAAIDEVRA